MRKYLLQFLSLFLLCFVIMEVQAQQDAQYTQYMYNTISINPAYAGSRDVLSVVGLHRSQWIGIDGAPRTNTLSLHSPVGQSRRVGLGGSIINDEIGPVNETYLSGDFSYTIPTSVRGKLSFGLKATAHLINVNFNKLTINETDPEFAQGIDNTFNPNVGVGIFYHNEKSYIGLSVPNLLETDHFDIDNAVSTGSVTNARERVNFYLIGGHIFELSDVVKFKPAVLGKLVNGAPLQVDVSANFLFNDRFTIGAAYRWSAAISALVGFQISDSLMLGLAYDRETTELQQFNSGSFEVMLRYELFQRYSKVITPRFF